MIKTAVLCGAIVMAPIYVADQKPFLIDVQDKPTEYTFMVVGVTVEGKKENNHFFVGRLPTVGEAVEMVYVGDTNDGDMRFQLRVKQ